MQNNIVRYHAKYFCFIYIGTVNEMRLLLANISDVSKKKLVLMR